MLQSLYQLSQARASETRAGDRESGRETFRASWFGIGRLLRSNFILRTRRFTAERAPDRKHAIRTTCHKFHNTVAAIGVKDGMKMVRGPIIYRLTRVQLQSRGRLGLVPEDFIDLAARSYPAVFEGSSGDGKTHLATIDNEDVGALL